jgi:autotransporter-associated beta strand protein
MRFLPSALRHAGFGLLPFLALSLAPAQTTTWNNTGADWGNAANWTTGVPNNNGTTAVFAGGSPQNPVIDAAFAIQRLFFPTTASAYTFSGLGSITFDPNSASTADAISLNGFSGTQTFDVDLTFANSGAATTMRLNTNSGGGTMVFAAGRTLTLNDNVSASSSSGAPGTFHFYGNITGAGTFTSLTTAGGSTTFHSGMTYSAGQLTANTGTIYLETDSLGSALLASGGSSHDGGGFVITANGLNITNRYESRGSWSTSGTVNYNLGSDIAGSGTATFSGNVEVSDTNVGSLTTTRNLTLVAGAGDRMVFSGTVLHGNGTTQPTANIFIDGGGTVVLSGNNTYNVATTVNAGTVLLANNTAGSATGVNSVTVNGTLGGTGRIAPEGANGLTVNSGGIVAPGDGVLGHLEINLAGTTGTASFLSGSAFVFKLDAPGFSDGLAFTGLTASSGDVVFNNNVVNFEDLGGLAPGLYTLMTFDAADAYTGTLVVGAGLGSYSGEFIYNADSIQLNVVPEPSTAALLGAAGLLAWSARRRRA